MLHKETVEAGTLDLIKKLAADRKLENFFLVGGTALSLLIGHRISIDIDLFTPKEFDSIDLRQHLEQVYGMTNAKTIKNGVFGFINEVKVDLIAHQYPLIKPLQEVEGIRLAALEDIGAMKLHAIYNSGSRYKDFVDVFFLLEHRPLHFIAAAYEKKYPDTNRSMAFKALVYFNDIDYTVPIKLMEEILTREVLENRLKNAIIHPLSLYASINSKQTQSVQRKKGPRL